MSLLAVAMLASLASSVFDLYETFWWVDETLHVYFTFCLTLVLVLYAYGKVLTGRCHHQVLLVLTVTGLGLACGTLWEITEWLYDHLVSSDAVYATTNPITDNDRYDDRHDHELDREFGGGNRDLEDVGKVGLIIYTTLLVGLQEKRS